MPVDSPEYIASQRDNRGGSSTLFWIFLIVVIMGGAFFIGHVSR
jgi:hypothetical protein